MSPLRTLLFLVIGIVAWALAALLIGAAGPVLLEANGARMVTYGVTALVSPLVTGLVAWATGTRLQDMVWPMGVMVMIATLFDGIALAWFPWIYGGPGEIVGLGGALILWGVGCLMLSALVFAWRADPAD